MHRSWLLLFATALPAQQTDPAPRPTWLAPGKGDIRLEFHHAAARPAPCVLIAGDGPLGPALGQALAARGVTAAICASATRHTLAAADGLLRLNAGELGIDTRRTGLAAVAGGAAAALELTMEDHAAAAGLALVGTFAPVIEDLRKDLPLCVAVPPDVDAGTAAGARELAHQAALAGAPVQFAAAGDGVAVAARFFAARLLPAPADAAATDALLLRELARATADRGDAGEALRLLDRALAAQPELAAELAGDHGFARIRASDAYREFLRTRAPTGALRLCPETETGAPIEVRCRFVASDGAPLASLLVDVWQTDTLGFYNHARSGDGEPRLWGAVRTDEHGAFTLRSVRPGGYPTTMIPSHVHLRVHLPGRAREVELLFADDPRLSPELAERRTKQGYGIASLDRQGAGDAAFRLPPAR